MLSNDSESGAAKQGRKRTPERILETALALFNEEGEPNVTTNAIADEMDISPGNLHYHFKSKSDLVEALFSSFDNEMTALLVHQNEQDADVVSAWMQLHLLFELMWANRFIYRDLSHLLQKYPRIRRRAAQLLHRKISVAQRGCEAFGVMEETGDSAALARNIVVVMTYWLSFELACRVEGNEQNRFGRGVYQVFSMLLPYLEPDQRALLLDLASEYRQ